jgi:hypothetical protein
MSSASLEADAPLRPLAKLGLAFEVVGSYVRARRLLRGGDVRAALSQQRAVAPRRPRPGDPVAAGRRLGRVVARTLAFLPGDTRCLTQSLVLTRLLASRGIESRVVIGVRPGDAFAAHAWVELGGIALLPTGGSAYGELVTL